MKAKKIITILLILMFSIVCFGQKYLGVYPRTLVAGDSVPILPGDKIFGISIEMYDATSDSSVLYGRTATLHGKLFRRDKIKPGSTPFNVGFIEGFVLDTCSVRSYGNGRLYFYKVR